MKFPNTYKNIVALLFIISVQIFSQGNPENIKEGYYINPTYTPHGIVVTDDFESTLYLLNSSTSEKLISAPGCGRYFTISKDGNKIGFKYIDPQTRLQSPAVFDLKTKTLKKLHEPVEYAGQVTFSETGKTAYTIYNKLFILGDRIEIYDLNVYSNWTPISPDGNSVIFKDNNDQLWLFDLIRGTKSKITDDLNGYASVKWAPNNTQIVYQSLNANLYYYDFATLTQTFIDNGEEAQWAPSGNKIAYHKRLIDFDQFQTINSDIYEYDVRSANSKNITNTPNIVEVQSKYISEDELLYNHFDNSEIKKISTLDSDYKRAETIYKLNDSLMPVKYNSSTIKNVFKTQNEDLDKWVHIHQVFDTRDSGPWTYTPGGKHQGYRCCGATAAMEAIATYRIVPQWPFTTYGHTSIYGQYMSDEFTYMDYTFSGFSTGTTIGYPTGAHGFMWNSGSPSSRTVSFLAKFGVTGVRSDNTSWNKVKAELDEGFPYILCSTSLTSGHIVLAIGQYGENHSLICNDPYGDKNAGSYGRIYNGKQAIYDWADANTGHMKISPVVWGVTARFTPELQLMESYPGNGDEDLACNANLVLVFDAPIDPLSVEGNLFFTDEAGNNLPFHFDENSYSFKQVILCPEQELLPDNVYQIVIKKDLADIYNCSFTYDTTLIFKTANELPVYGQPVSRFESIENYSITTSNVIDSITSFAVTTKELISGNSAGILNYEFNDRPAGYCRIMDETNIILSGDPDSSFGLWISGDASMNTIEIWFNKSTGGVVKGFEGILNWSGWKFQHIPVANINNGNSVSLNSIAVRNSGIGKSSGIVLFDEASLFKTSDLVTNVNSETILVPKSFSLNQNYPNPFNPVTTIKYSLPTTSNGEMSKVSLRIYDVLGREVAVLVNKEQTTGEYKVKFDASHLSSGIYLYTLSAGKLLLSKKMVLLK